MRKFLPFFLFFAFQLIFLQKAHAQTNFSTFYDVSYQVSENEVTSVAIDVDLKNNTTDFYADSYNIQTGFDNITNIKATDLGGELKYSAKKNEKGTLLSFDFNQKVVGINKTQEFSLSFDSREIAKKYGDIWEINIPGVANQEDYASFNTTVIVPKSFGNPNIIKPEALGLKSSQNSLSFSKNDLGKGGISIAYGDAQVYSFILSYHLQNKNLYPITTEIAIPSDNNYQSVLIDEMNPKPSDVHIDSDGNWLAKYKLLPSQNLDVTVKGLAKISYKPAVETLTKVQEQMFLLPQKHWESDDAEIKKLARELKTPEKIFNYVVENLKYDNSRVKEVQIRAGAKVALKNKNSAVCLEFTDLFIALARSAGIPARSVEGYANTSNSADRPLSLFKDILHSWPEYYDFKKGAWIMVDPTWQNTTEGIDYFNVLDFDHFAFVIKGADSEYPVPAGGYKIPGQKSTQDVEVAATDIYVQKLPVLTAYTSFSKSYLGGFPIKGEITINNDSGVLAPNQTVLVTSDRVRPSPQSLYFDKIPPFGKKVLAVQFSPKPFLTNETDIIKIAIGQQTLEKGIVIQPFYSHIYFITVLIGGLIIGGTIGVISIIIYKRRRIPVSG